MSTRHTSVERTERPFAAGVIRKFSVPIILVWLAVTAVVSIAVPALEQVAKEHARSLSTKDAPSVKATERIGELFKESGSDATAAIVFEGQQPLGEDAHRYYADLIRQLQADPAHVRHIQDFWGDPLTATAAQSPDGKAAIVQLNLAGNQGEPLANESAKAVRDIVHRMTPPSGLKVYVTGSTPLSADLINVGERTVVKSTLATVVVIFLLLLLVYRS